MGYTHYWFLENDIPATAWRLILKDVRNLISHFDGPLCDVIADADDIVLNGAEPEGYETFWLGRKARQHHRFCKTGHRPYDKLVCAILSVANEQFPPLSVSSDAVMGSEPDGWPDACAWASEVLGREITEPWERSMMKLPKWFSFLYRKYWWIRRPLRDLSHRVDWEECRFSKWWRRHLD
jgi:hypothetical protein